MSSYMIDENKNLVSDKLWEFFATPFNDNAPNLSTFGKPEVGEIIVATVTMIDNTAVQYEWKPGTKKGETYLIKKVSTSSSTVNRGTPVAVLYTFASSFEAITVMADGNMVPLRLVDGISNLTFSSANSMRLNTYLSFDAVILRVA